MRKFFAKRFYIHFATHKMHKFCIFCGNCRDSCPITIDSVLDCHVCIMTFFSPSQLMIGQYFLIASVFLKYVVKLIGFKSKKFVHAGDTTFFLVEIWMHIEVERCRHI